MLFYVEHFQSNISLGRIDILNWQRVLLTPYSTNHVKERIALFVDNFGVP